jgi:rubrerythrin
MHDFSLYELHTLLTCLNESIHFYEKQIANFDDFSCKNVLNYTMEKDKLLAKKIETEISKYSSTS